MKTHDDLLIDAENKNFGSITIALVFDDHIKHIWKHIPYAWKPRVFRHIIDHIILHRHRVKENIPLISLEDVMKAQKNNSRD